MLRSRPTRYRNHKTHQDKDPTGNTKVKTIGPCDLISQTPTPDCVFGAALKRLDVRSRITEIDVQEVSQQGTDGAGTHPGPNTEKGLWLKVGKLLFFKWHLSRMVSSAF